MAQCTAKSKRSGVRCKRRAAIGRTTCSMHGGKTPRGIASPNLIHGRHSIELPARLGERYEQAMKDQDILNLHDEIALIDARTSDVLKRVDSGESGAIWHQLREAHELMAAAQRAGDREEVAACLNEISQLIRRGHADYAAWAEVQRLSEQRRRLVDSERKRRVDMQQMLSVESAMLLLAAVTDSVKRHVTDPAARAAISADLSRLAAHEAGPVPPPGH